MAIYEVVVDQANQPILQLRSNTSPTSNYIPVELEEMESGTPLFSKTSTTLIEGVLPSTKGGTGIDELTGSRIIASNVDGTSFEEVDVSIKHLFGLRVNVQDKLDSIRTYITTIAPDDWVFEDTMYHKEVSLSGITSNDYPIIGLSIQSSNPTDIESEKYAYSCIDRVSTGTDKVTFYCFYEAPSTEITLTLTCV